MKLFQCSNCGQPVYFDNRVCVACGGQLGFLPEKSAMYTVAPADGGLWQSAVLPSRSLRFCANAATDVCNWMLTDAEAGPYCSACRHNRIVPVTDKPEGLRRWQRIGQAQRHLFYSLIRLNLPHPDRSEDPEAGLVFDFLADELDGAGNIVPAMTGYEGGVIRLRAAEADDETRESIRVSMNEPYRTLLGHFRHEIGHFYWAQRVRGDQALLEEARALFGDERQDYAEALRRNYEHGPPPDWQDRFISTYASCHPAEDFAECWAHYFHIVDTLETARAFGLSTDPHHRGMAAEVDFDPYAAQDAQALVDAWIPLSVALNSIQRSMGQPDSYPFVLSPPVIEKLGFIGELIHTR
ncbi:putative zinc-binding metallopeptidase [Sinorhizobium sp. 7-81]|uniref:zinc-binding metallopeptidase family protein n=1 Tax=Sinorhizobium sp. 8-89 TaxID=3049089 RepID=UPI0024C2360B|nr:putative zinc-binding metallopeptidase [Sinorhizobium sp. 8-89]MDK1488812.1 putative zinc-binding metallopeptidase [Sinorhizobium sp. 8-89]